MSTSPTPLFMSPADSGGSVSVGHGPGTRRNEGTSNDRGTGTPDSNLTEIDATQEPQRTQVDPQDKRRARDEPAPTQTQRR